MMFRHGGYSGKSGHWFVFGKTRRFRLDWKQPIEKDGWVVTVTRVATWKISEDPLVFHSYEVTH